MNYKLAQNVNEDEKVKNDALAYNFVISILEMNEKILFPYLTDEHKYLDGKTKWQTIAYFKRFFSPFLVVQVEIFLEQWISIDVYPGSTAYKFIFREPLSEGKPLGELKLVLAFENGKIKDIAYCKKAIKKEKAYKLSTQN